MPISIEGLSQGIIDQLNKKGCTFSGYYKMQGEDIWTKFEYNLANVEELKACMRDLPASISDGLFLNLSLGTSKPLDTFKRIRKRKASRERGYGRWLPPNKGS